MSNSVNIECLVASIQLVVEGAIELQLAVREQNRMKDCQGNDVEVDLILENAAQELIGVRKNNEGRIEFIVQDEKSVTAKQTIDQVRQTYARLKVLNEVKRKGYQQVKEEKLPDGSIRLVVQRWR